MSAGGRQHGAGDNELAGIYYGIVTRNDDPDGPGARVRVSYPWLPNGGQQDGFWAQLCVPMVGANFGVYVVPEVDDMVAVVFLNGDIRQGVVLGGVWSQPDPPPENNANGQNDFRLLKSRSGHRVLLDDSSKTKVVVSDYKNRNLIATGQYEEGGAGRNAFKVPVPGSMGGGKPVEGAAIAAMEGGATLNVWCPAGTLSIRGKDVEISAGTTLDIKAKTIQVKGKTTTISARQPALFEGKPIKAGS